LGLRWCALEPGRSKALIGDWVNKESKEMSGLEMYWGESFVSTAEKGIKPGGDHKLGGTSKNAGLCDNSNDRQYKQGYVVPDLGAGLRTKIQTRQVASLDNRGSGAGVRLPSRGGELGKGTPKKTCRYFWTWRANLGGAADNLMWGRGILLGNYNKGETH